MIIANRNHVQHYKNKTAFTLRHTDLQFSCIVKSDVIDSTAPNEWMFPLLNCCVQKKAHYWLFVCVLHICAYADIVCVSFNWLSHWCSTSILDYFPLLLLLLLKFLPLSEACLNQQDPCTYLHVSERQRWSLAYTYTSLCVSLCVCFYVIIS